MNVRVRGVGTCVLGEGGGHSTSPFTALGGDFFVFLCLRGNKLACVTGSCTWRADCSLEHACSVQPDPVSSFVVALILLGFGVSIKSPAMEGE